MDEQRPAEVEADGVGENGHVDVTALALGHIDARRRMQMAAHLLACAECRREYDEMAAAVRDLLPVIPAVQPPLGFDQQVLGRLGITSARGRHRRHVAWLTSAAAALVLAIAVVAWQAIVDNPPASAGRVANLQLAADGTSVGTVSIDEVRGQTVMVVALISAPEDVSYRCRTTFADGTTAESEPWPAEYGAWIVPLPESANHQIDGVELVLDGTNHVWSRASFDHTD